MKAKNGEASGDDGETVRTKKNTKRVLEECSGQASVKKQKIEKYKLSPDLEKTIAKDEVNGIIWTSCKEQLEQGKLVSDNIHCFNTSNWDWNLGSFGLIRCLTISYSGVLTLELVLC